MGKIPNYNPDLATCPSATPFFNGRACVECKLPKYVNFNYQECMDCEADMNFDPINK